MHVYPKPGLKIFDPQLKDYLPMEGRAVPPTPFWHRRLQDGDVTLEKPQSIPAPSAATTAAQE